MCIVHEMATELPLALYFGFLQCRFVGLCPPSTERGSKRTMGQPRDTRVSVLYFGGFPGVVKDQHVQRAKEPHETEENPCVLKLGKNSQLWEDPYPRSRNLALHLPETLQHEIPLDV